LVQQRVHQSTPEMELINQLLSHHPLCVILLIVCSTVCVLVGIIASHNKKAAEARLTAQESAKESVSKDSSVRNDAEGDQEDDIGEPEPVVKKNIAFNTVYNLEEFMIRLYKLGFFVIRVKNDGTRKERFISIDQKGNLCFHKLASVGSNEQPRRYPSPYIRLPISTLQECFACEDSDEPSFILDFQRKLLHLVVHSKVDRDYLVKGIKLVAQRAKRNSNFLLRSSSLLEDTNTPGGPEDVDDEQSMTTATTMNTSFRRR
jgi:hypothetical protein